MACVFVGVGYSVAVSFRGGREGGENVTSDDLAFAATLGRVGTGGWDTTTDVVVEEALGAGALGIVGGRLGEMKTESSAAGVQPSEAFWVHVFTAKMPGVGRDGREGRGGDGHRGGSGGHESGDVLTGGRVWWVWVLVMVRDNVDGRGFSNKRCGEVYHEKAIDFIDTEGVIVEGEESTRVGKGKFNAIAAEAANTQ